MKKVSSRKYFFVIIFYPITSKLFIYFRDFFSHQKNDLDISYQLKRSNCMKRRQIFGTRCSPLCGYQRPSRGVDPRDTHGQPAGMVGDLLKNLAREPGAFAFRGKHPRDPIHGICRWSRSIMVSANSLQSQARPIDDGSAFRRVIFH